MRQLTPAGWRQGTLRSTLDPVEITVKNARLTLPAEQDKGVGKRLKKCGDGRLQALSRLLVRSQLTRSSHSEDFKSSTYGVMVRYEGLKDMSVLDEDKGRTGHTTAC